MNRLTKYICGAAHGKCGRTVEEASKSKKYCRGKFEATGCVDRLAAYEDTGLEPEEIPQWIPISERLPEIGRNCLVRITGVGTDIAYYEEVGVWRIYDVKWGGEVTHWMPLPQPPKGEK